MNNHSFIIPDHIDPANVLHFDVFADDMIAADPHEGFIKLREIAPSGLFWSTANGGYWVIMDPDAINRTLRSPELFTNSQLTIPKMANPPRMIPESLDPPEHMQYRSAMMGFFTPTAIQAMEGKIIERCAGLIAEVKDKGGVSLWMLLPGRYR